MITPYSLSEKDVICDAQKAMEEKNSGLLSGPTNITVRIDTALSSNFRVDRRRSRCRVSTKSEGSIS